MGDRLALTGLEAMDLEAAQRKLDRAIAKRNHAERELNEARWELDRIMEKHRRKMYTDEQLRMQAGRTAP